VLTVLRARLSMLCRHPYVLQETARLQKQIEEAQSQLHPVALVTIAQQRFAAAQATTADLSDTDVLVATPETLLEHLKVNTTFRDSIPAKGSNINSGSGSGSNTSTTTSSSTSSNPGDLLCFNQLYWFVADEAGLREVDTGDTARSIRDAIWLRHRLWCKDLASIAELLPSAAAEHSNCPVAADVEMSEAARMMYLAEVRVRGKDYHRLAHLVLQP
jgi:hypothetical protein